MDKKKILFGCGNAGKKAYKYYGASEIYAFCDNYKRDDMFMGKKVISYDELMTIHNNYDIIISVIAHNAQCEIKEKLDNDGIEYVLFSEVIEKKSQGSIKDAFSTIYKCNLWGGDNRFYSGSGSHTYEIILPYIEYLNHFISLNSVKSICDIGCGDFYIMNKVLNNNQQIDYCGVDIVEELIEFNKKEYGKENIKFVCMDVSSDDVTLPPAELLIIRQVLQHLDNERIMKILSKTRGYKYILISEHIYEGNDVRYNLDKTPNASIRLKQQSGVYIEKSPFNIKNLVHVLKVPETEGIIRTSLIVQCV